MREEWINSSKIEKKVIQYGKTVPYPFKYWPTEASCQENIGIGKTEYLYSTFLDTQRCFAITCVYIQTHTDKTNIQRRIKQQTKIDLKKEWKWVGEVVSDIVNGFEKGFSAGF